MSVRYRGVTHRVTYNPGPDGLQQFLDTLQSIGIKVASASQVTFLCRSPDTGEEMALKGLTAFDAAAYCASITAAKRVQQKQQRADAVAVAAATHYPRGAHPAQQQRRVSDASDMGIHHEPEAAEAAPGAHDLGTCTRRRGSASQQPQQQHGAAPPASASLPARHAPAASFSGAQGAAPAAAPAPRASWLRRLFGCAQQVPQL